MTAKSIRRHDRSLPGNDKCSGASPSVRRGLTDGLVHRLCLVPTVALLGFAVLMPLALLIRASLVDQQTGEPTLAYYVTSLGDALFMRTLATTIAMASGVTALSIALALPVAYVLARRTILRGLLLPLVGVPQMLPFVVIGYAIVLLLAPYTGVMSKLLLKTGILSEPTFVLFDWPGQALAFAYTGLVMAIAMLTRIFMSIDPSLEDMAVTLGAPRLRAVATVTIQLGMPGIITAGALIFSTVVTAYAIPVMLNSRTPYMVSVLIYNNLNSLPERHLAYAQTVIVSVLALGVTIIAQSFLARSGNRQ